MSSSISPIGVNSQSIGNAYGFGLLARKNPKSEQAPEVAQQAPVQESKVSADAMLDYMAKSAAFSPAVVTQQTVNPANYVDDASSARISQSMKDFESLVQENLSTINQEFPYLSDKTAYALAAKMLDAA